MLRFCLSFASLLLRTCLFSAFLFIIIWLFTDDYVFRLDLVLYELHLKNKKKVLIYYYRYYIIISIIYYYYKYYYYYRYNNIINNI